MSVYKESGVRVPITDEMVLDWYAMTDPRIRETNPSLLKWAEEIRARQVASCENCGDRGGPWGRCKTCNDFLCESCLELECNAPAVGHG